MDETVNLSFRYSQSDYSAMRSHYASAFALDSTLPYRSLLALAGAYLLRIPSWHWFGMFFVATSAVFVLILLAAFVIIPPVVFRIQPKFRDEYSLTFSQKAIHFRTAHIDSQLRWSLYSRALVDSHSYLLYYGSRTFTVIPKRAFQSADQQHAFEHLLAQHVLKIVTKK
jgi:hypothetical protein